MTSHKSDIAESEFQEIEKLLGSVAKEFKSNSDSDFLKTITKIGKYRVNSLLGYGGQAACFLANDDELERLVVIKLYRGGLTEEMRTRILREGQSLAQVRSPHVATCFAVERYEDRPFLVLEYIQGKTLEEWVRGQELTDADIRRLIEGVLNGLDAVHSKGLLHLDLKPSNIIVDENGQAVLIDFGLSQASTSDPGMRITGTPSFIAPERIIENSVNSRTDIYGVGALIYFLLAKQPPFTGATKKAVLAKIIHDEVNWENADPTNRFASLVRIGKKCMSKLPSQRYENTTDVADALQNSKPDEVVVSPKIAGPRYLTPALAGLVILALMCSYLAYSEFFRPDLNTQSRSTENKRAMQDVEQIPTQWLRQISGSELRNDFLLSCGLQPDEPKTFVSDQNHPMTWSSNRTDDDRSLSLSLDQKYFLEAIPMADCHVAVFSLEFTNGSENINHVELVAPLGSDTELTKKGETFRCTIQATSPTPVNKQELLWVFASSKKFDPDLIAARMRLDLLNDDYSVVKNLEWAASGVMRGIKGVKAEKELVTGTVSLYRVQ
ncbi:MAG: serine/threonine protein kinase [Mariniblastus sp.]